ncbi:DUF1294 domain-containing protein [Massilia phyllosphaerae]|uniref:DUF1294 domain-containing protein n=1 Tax=Massilia phyllosphaerae TaxID=3106034 RepID=UPI002B1CCC74|nr:DUF1294 domain-containing protein [Massilia sp. SGZ-792]
MTPYAPLLLFLILYAWTTWAWGVPAVVGLLYLAVSALCFAAYALDKSAARRKERRTPERTLLLLGLAGGWPGGLLAQQWLRHKTVKQPFRRLFWITVAVNAGAFVWMARRLLAPID